MSSYSSKIAIAYRTCLFSDINISQGSVVMRLSCGRIFNDRVIVNLLETVTVNGFRKSTSI